MPTVNFNDATEPEYDILPAGEYLCQVSEVYPKITKTGDEYWTLELTVREGPHVGRKIFDNLFFTHKALNRLKLVYHRLTGMELTGEVWLESKDLFECRAYVDVIIEDHEYKGEKSKRNRVSYGGYRAIDNTAPKSTDEVMGNEPLPF